MNRTNTALDTMTVCPHRPGAILDRELARYSYLETLPVCPKASRSAGTFLGPLNEPKSMFTPGRSWIVVVAARGPPYLCLRPN
jgi:hypothetical protein